MSNIDNTPSPFPSDASSMIFLNTENISDCLQVQQQEPIQKQRLGSQLQALVALARSKTIDRGDLKAALREITEVAADVLQVEQTSIWLYPDTSCFQKLQFSFSSPVSDRLSDSNSEADALSQLSDTALGSGDELPHFNQITERSCLKCLDLYQKSQGCHTSGREIGAANYPAYFQALATKCTIAAHDARTDGRTQEFSESYLTPNGITSILNAPVWLNGQMVGIVCHEHTNSQRQWTPIEENFVEAIATLVALTIEACNRVLAQKQLRQHHQHLLSEYHDDLERLVEERTAELTKANEKLQQEINRRSSVEARVRKYQHHLEELVEERAQKIIKTNEQLQQEIASHKRVQEALRESEEQFRCLSEATFEAVLITEQGKLCQVNSNFARLFGYESCEVIGMSALEFVASESRACVQQIMALDSEQMYESLCLKKDGTTFPAEVRSKAIPYQGRLVRVTAIRDITAQSKAQEELKKSVSLLHATLNSTTDGIVAVSPAQEIVSFNQKFVEMWGISEEILRSPNQEDRFGFFQEQVKEPEAFLKRVRQLYAQPQAEGYDILELKDGRIFERFTQPQRSGQHIIGRVWSYRDITERAWVERVLRQHLQQEQLIAVMSDRIRQSLNLKEILHTTAEEVRQFLQTDRVLIYRFEPDWTGAVVVESVASEYKATLGMAIYDPCFGEFQVQPYQQGRIQAVTDIHRGGLTPCYIKFLSQLQVRANLVVPILQGVSSQRQESLDSQAWGLGSKDWDEPTFTLVSESPLVSFSNSQSPVSDHPSQDVSQGTTEERGSLPALWGLLIAHHCSGPRQWQQFEIDLLKSLATQVAIAIQQSSLFEQLEAANQELHRLACVDGLTQVANRRHFDEYLDVEWRRLAREQRPLSLILCDVDYFKVYNDTYGHLAGDFCLKQIADTLRQGLRRPADLVARYGGEEFAVILPNTEARGAVLIAEAIRKGVRGLEIAHAESPVSQYVTLSLGVASAVPLPNAPPTQLIAAADEALYQAKAEGRDRVVITLS